jgi:dolichyl-phosphate-mannose-protein mannosyltransferase
MLSSDRAAMPSTVDRAWPAAWSGRNVLRVTAALALVMAAGLYLARALDHGHRERCESSFQAVVDRLRHEPVSGQWLQSPHLTLCAYGPGHFWAALGLEQLSGGQIDSRVSGRLVSLLALLATAALLGRLVARHTASFDRGLLTALLYVVSPVAYYWIPANRVDALAVLFVAAAYASLGSSRRSVLVCAALLALGSLVKQPVALSAGAVFVHLLVWRRVGDALTFAVAVAVLGSALWLGLNWHSDGYYLAIAVKGNLNRMILSKGLVLAAWFLAYPFGLACLAAVGVVTRAGLRRDPRASLFCLGFCASVLLGLVMGCKEGAYINYFLEASALGSVLIGVCPWTFRFAERRPLVRWALPVLLVAPNLCALALFPGSSETLPNERALKAILATQREPQPLLADLKWIDSVLASNHWPAVNEPYMLRMTVESHCLDARPIVAAMARGDIPLLVLDRSLQSHLEEQVPDWPQPVLDAMAAHYEPLTTAPGLFVYRHRAAVAFRDVPDAATRRY